MLKSIHCPLQKKKNDPSEDGSEQGDILFSTYKEAR